MSDGLRDAERRHPAGKGREAMKDRLASEIAREALLEEFRCDCGRTKPCDPCELFGETGADVKRPRVAWPV